MDSIAEGGIQALRDLTIGRVIARIEDSAAVAKELESAIDEQQFSEILRTRVLPILGAMGFAVLHGAGARGVKQEAPRMEPDSSKLSSQRLPVTAKRTGFETGQMLLMKDRLSTTTGVLHMQSMSRTHSSSRMNATALVLEDLIPRPLGKITEWKWKDEYKAAVAEGMAYLGKSLKQPAYKHRASVELLLGTETGKKHVELKTGVLTEHHEESGFHKVEAQALECLLTPPVRYAVGRALESHPTDVCYAALTHITYDAIARNCKDQNKHRLANACFRHMSDPFKTGLADTDERWRTVDSISDEHGFFGFTTYAPLKMRQPCDRFFSSEGLRVKDPSKAQHEEYNPVDCPVVKFVSKMPTGGGSLLHSALWVGGDDWVLPPLTLLTVIKITRKEKGFNYLGKRIHQKLITVMPTFMLPAHISQRDTFETEPHRFASHRTFLTFGNLRDVVTSVEDIVAHPVLTMKQEWLDFDRHWTKEGAEYSARIEWQYVDGRAKEGARTKQYVNGAAKEGKVAKENGTAKEGAHAHAKFHRRDAKHGGMTVEDFMREANEYIKRERATLNDRQRAKTTEMYRPAHSPDEQEQDVDEKWLLTRDETLALRLYSGPAFQPINFFLREVGKLGSDWRQRISRLPEFTLAATTRHILDGMRKLAAANSNYVRVYRAVIGELPDAFRLLDMHGQITATDFAFMSTSTDERITSKYMVRAKMIVLQASPTFTHTYSQKGGTDSILFEIECSPQSYEGIHNGADISMLSQFPGEDEILFPPLTVLTVTGVASSNANHLPAQLRPTANGVLLDIGIETSASLTSALDFQHEMPTMGMKGVSNESLASFGRRRSVSTSKDGQTPHVGHAKDHSAPSFHRIKLFPTFT
jgi:hypothetical protein